MKMWRPHAQGHSAQALSGPQTASLNLPFPDVSTDGWNYPSPGAKVRLGGDAHKRLFCRTLLDTFDPYRPAVIDWPKLDPDAQGRLTSLPIWDLAVQNEGGAMRRVEAYADAVREPLVKKALELNAFEEGRHKLVLSNLVEAYGIKLAPQPPYPAPADPEWAFMITGFGECVDSFFAFGLFDAAKRSGYFPPELVDTFEPVIAEEGRHILFFVNWIAWHRRNMPWWRRAWFELKVLAAWAVVGFRRMSIAASAGGAAKGQPVAAAASEQFGNGIDVAQLMDTCLAENDRRLAKYDPRLIRPTFVPAMARLARRFFVKPAPA
jgi:hypothetical protein